MFTEFTTPLGQSQHRFVIAGLTRNPGLVWHWIPDQVRDDSSWVRDDNCRVRDDGCGVRDDSAGTTKSAVRRAKRLLVAKVSPFAHK